MSFIDANGKRKYISGTGTTPSAALKRRQDKMLALGGEGSAANVRSRSMRLSEYLPIFLDKQDYEKASAVKTEANIRRHVIAYHDWNISQITPELLEHHFFKTLPQAGVGPSAIQHTRSSLSALLTRATKDSTFKDFNINPLKLVVQPKEGKVSKVKADYDKFLERDTEIAERIVNWLGNPENPLHEHYPMFCLMLLGLRVGEIRGLSFNNVSHFSEPSRARLIVQQQLQWEKGSGWYIERRTKNNISRYIPLDPVFRNAILLQQKKADDGFIATEQRWQDEKLMFLRQTRDGVTPMTNNIFNRIYYEVYGAFFKKPWKGITGYKLYCHPHTWRHIACCRMFHQGVPIEVCAAYLGDGVDVVRGTYLHLERSAMSAASKALASGIDN
jgi:integrase